MSDTSYTYRPNRFAADQAPTRASKAEYAHDPAWWAMYHRACAFFLEQGHHWYEDADMIKWAEKTRQKWAHRPFKLTVAQIRELEIMQFTRERSIKPSIQDYWATVENLSKRMAHYDLWQNFHTLRERLLENRKQGTKPPFFIDENQFLASHTLWTRSPWKEALAEAGKGVDLFTTRLVDYPIDESLEAELNLRARQNSPSGGIINPNVLKVLENLGLDLSTNGYIPAKMWELKERFAPRQTTVREDEPTRT